jgi:hypothetical protein
MDIERPLLCRRRPAALAGALAVLCVLTTGAAFAQAQGANKAAAPDIFTAVGQWLDRQAENLSSSLRSAGKGFEEFGHEAGIAARTTADNAKGAAGAVANLPGARVVLGHAKCQIAPNGAPDCLAAADEVCRAKGFRSGKSLDMTTAEICPPKVYLAGRNSGPGCHTETFVSRAFCQ